MKTLKLYSFSLTAKFGIFPDPTITTNKVTYYLPNKTQIIGLLGAIIGIKRGIEENNLYSKEFVNFLNSTKIGIKMENLPEKMVFFTNHISLKKRGAKPFKTELLINPKLKIYFTTSEKYENEIKDRISDGINKITKKGYYYTPYLGNAYCLANLNNLKYEGSDTEYKKLNKENLEGGYFNINSIFIQPAEDIEYYEIKDKSLIMEYHLLHILNSDKLNVKVVKYYAPYPQKSAISVQIQDYNEGICEFYQHNSELLCLF